ncbi:MAG: hypothetical protein ABUL66_00465 [Verrucomicrobiota bacterium]
MDYGKCRQFLRKEVVVRSMLWQGGLRFANKKEILMDIEHRTEGTMRLHPEKARLVLFGLGAPFNSNKTSDSA